VRCNEGSANESNKIGDSCSALHDATEDFGLECPVNESTHWMNKLHSTTTDITTRRCVARQERQRQMRA
jgi:hypothetical protein